MTSPQKSCQTPLNNVTATVGGSPALVRQPLHPSPPLMVIRPTILRVIAHGPDPHSQQAQGVLWKCRPRRTTVSDCRRQDPAAVLMLAA
ncbi:hypothetical protein ACFCXS_33680 [Streptomyces sp. NPDC056373]|uniref:hypothetical protein n=1 Tax=Streptomyces sp. NPDC056373 TaxID=3345798 RepID=UPI0035DFC76B